MEDEPWAALGPFARRSRTIRRHDVIADADAPDRLWVTSPCHPIGCRHRASPLAAHDAPPRRHVFPQTPVFLPEFTDHHPPHDRGGGQDLGAAPQPPVAPTSPLPSPRSLCRHRRPPRDGPASVRSHLAELKRRQSSIDEVKRQAEGGGTPRGAPQVSAGHWAGPQGAGPHGAGPEGAPPSRGVGGDGRGGACCFSHH
ncbi:translation initiation factor IF-2-like [Grus americana]|uniref:translation initiation factor IF-2-like n=1 Tax=Grus americana TaxID=9117 RepID=UPI002407CB77|nr:translation initiation factor IF-2-like [Grus americana]